MRIALFLLTLALSSPCMAALDANYPFSSTFAGVTQLQAGGIIDTGNNYPDGITDRLIIEDGVLRARVSSSDTLTAGGHRSEIVHAAGGRSEYWYTWQTMIPTSGWDDAASMAVMQIHESPDVGDAARHPNFLIIIENGQIIARVPSATLPTESQGGTRIAVAPLVKDRWYSFAFRASWQITGIGFRELYIDGVPVLKQWNIATHYDDVTGPYLKIGAYDFFGTLSGEVTAYHANVKVWSGNDGWVDILGSLPVSPPYLGAVH